VWYLAELLFAEPAQADRAEGECEACNVVFQTPSAVEAYRKAVAWGLAHATEPPARMQFLGVAHLTTVGEELGDGTEICGRFFQSRAVWDRVGEMIPPPEQLPAIQWERGHHTPLGELLSPEQVARLKEAWGQGA
jgi:hypothetical protein